MPNGRAIALIAAALNCCGAAARAIEANPTSTSHALALPEARTLTLLAIALAGLAAFGRKRGR
jgi:hypothetical protein